MTNLEEDRLLALARAADNARMPIVLASKSTTEGARREPLWQVLRDINDALEAIFESGDLDRCNWCGQIETIEELHDPGDGQTRCHECRAG